MCKCGNPLCINPLHDLGGVLSMLDPRPLLREDVLDFTDDRGFLEEFDEEY